MDEKILEIVISILSVVISGWLLPLLSKWIKAKTNSERLKSVVDDLMYTATSAVDMVEQTIVKQLKEDNKWDSDGQKKALSKAVQIVVTNLAASTKNLLIENNQIIEDVAARYIECVNRGSKE